MPELRPYQRRGVDWLKSRKRAILADEPGTGKSCQALVAAELPLLVISPAAVMVHWRREAETWLGARKARAVQVLSWADPAVADADPDSFRTEVLDEAHYAKSAGALRTRRAMRLMRGVASRGGRAWALTGTLVPNRPAELWPILYALGLLPSRVRSWEAFTRRYCAARETEWGVDVRGSSHESELQALIAPHVLRRAQESVLRDLPPVSWRVLALDLPLPERQKRFDLAELRRLPESVPFEAVSDVLREHMRRKLPLAAEHLESLLQGGTDKVVAFAHHREAVHRLAVEGLPEGCARAAVVIGGQSQAERQAEVDRFQNDPACRLFVGQIQAGGVGLTLTAAHRVVIAEASWVPADLEQAAGRCHRFGQGRPVQVDVLTIHRSLDEHMLRRALEKVRVIERILPDEAADLLS